MWRMQHNIQRRGDLSSRDTVGDMGRHRRVHHLAKRVNDHFSLFVRAKEGSSEEPLTVIAINPATGRRVD